MKDHNYYVYIIASKKYGYFYTGVSNDLIRRVTEHKSGEILGYTKQYRIHMLVYYEYFDDVNEAIKREKIIKKWKRRYKIDAIERMNPNWNDLFFELIEDAPYNPILADLL